MFHRNIAQISLIVQSESKKCDIFSSKCHSIFLKCYLIFTSVIHTCYLNNIKNPQTSVSISEIFSFFDKFKIPVALERG